MGFINLARRGFMLKLKKENRYLLGLNPLYPLFWQYRQLDPFLVLCLKKLILLFFIPPFILFIPFLLVGLVNLVRLFYFRIILLQAKLIYHLDQDYPVSRFTFIR